MGPRYLWVATSCRTKCISFVVIIERRPQGTLCEAAQAKTQPGDNAMRVMVIVNASQESEAGVLPDPELLTRMGKFNEELVKAGVMLAGDGLHSSSKGERVRFSGATRTVIDGPFTETKELIAGYWLWQVRSMEEAVEWLTRAPFDGGSEVEIRQVFEAEGFGANLTPELREQEQRLRDQVASKK